MSLKKFIISLRRYNIPNKHRLLLSSKNLCIYIILNAIFLCGDVGAYGLGSVGIGPQNDVPANGLWHSPPSLHHLLFHVSSPGTFSKRSKKRDEGLENRSNSSSSKLPTLSPKLASRCCEPQERGRLLSDHNPLCAWRIVVAILADLYPCNRDSYEIRYSVESRHVPTSLITSAMCRGSEKMKSQCTLYYLGKIS